MAEPKTTKNDQSVEDFIHSVQDERKRPDRWTVLELMQRVTQEKPAMWGSSIVGYGDHPSSSIQTSTWICCHK
jgi:hypothetical protein